MARIRMIKPEFWDDEKLSSVSRDARLTFVGMWNNSDDYAVVKGHPAWLKNNIFPYDDIKITEFQKWLGELEGIGVIRAFEHNGEKFYHIKNFLKHQTINRPSPSKNPTPPTTINEDSLNTHGGLTPQIKLKEIKLNKKEININAQNSFARFYESYPKKKSKGQAEKAFLKINPDEQLLAAMIESIERAKKSEEWIREKGKYIPHPATWLNAQGWLDEDCEVHPLSGTVSDKTIKTVQMLEDWRPPV